MKAIARLIATYFSGTPLQFWITMIALTALVICVGEFYFFPELLFSGAAGANPLSGVQSAAMWLGPLIAIEGLFFGGASMPQVFWRLVTDRRVCVLPFGRLKLLCSALGTVVLVAFATAVVVAGMFKIVPNTHIDLVAMFRKSFVLTCLSGSVLYMALWFVSRANSAFGLLVGTIVAVPALVAPLGFVANPSTPIHGPFIACLALWIAFVAVVCYLPQLKLAVSLVTARAGAVVSRVHRMFEPAKGREVDLLVGAAYPWLFTFGQIIPILIVSQLISERGVWLYCLTIFGAISGATTSVATARSRYVWLRTPWSREQLFRRVESLFWRRNCYALSVHLLLLMAIGSYLSFAASLIAAGILLLVLANTLSTYLGLMMTKGLDWFDAFIAVGAMVLLLVTAVFVAVSYSNVLGVAALEVFLAAIALGFRFEASRRWTRIDWMLCRSMRVA